MVLDPAIAKKLMDDAPEIKALAQYIAEQALTLDSLDGLEKFSIEERGLEVTARMRAKAILQTILGSLLDVQDFKGSPMSKDYGVDVP